MKLVSSLLLLAATADAHYRFPKLIINGVAEEREWTSVRQTKNYQDNHGVTDVNSQDIRCFQNRAGSSTATVAAGDRLGFVAMSAVTHFGPVSFYMARVPEGRDINTWDGSGNVWFKVGEISAVPSAGGGLTSGEATWPAYNQKSVEFTVPKSIASGRYLVRVESIALHQAQNVGGAQIYLACGQVEVTGGGNGTPSQLVAFPGAYKSNDPGLLWSYYPVRTSYKAPGPNVWQG